MGETEPQIQILIYCNYQQVRQEEMPTFNKFWSPEKNIRFKLCYICLQYKPRAAQVSEAFFSSPLPCRSLLFWTVLLLRAGSTEWGYLWEPELERRVAKLPSHRSWLPASPSQLRALYVCGGYFCWDPCTFHFKKSLQNPTTALLFQFRQASVIGQRGGLVASHS